MLVHLRPALSMLLLMTVVTGLIYPLAITGIGQIAFFSASNGSAVVSNDIVVGSSLIGQNWSSDKYFWGRPSAAGKGYDAAASSGSNLGPTSKTLMDRIAGDIKRIQLSGNTPSVPADAVTASGSGLDPHISPAFAYLQVARVAKSRGITEDQLKTVVAGHVENPTLGFLGEPRVNVLLLNLALDSLNTSPNG
jgi:potassium-transporting ATPase KdpC subunit